MNKDRLELLLEFSKGRYSRGTESVSLHGNDVDYLIEEVIRLRAELAAKENEIEKLKRYRDHFQLQTVSLETLLREARFYVDACSWQKGSQHPDGCKHCKLRELIDAALLGFASPSDDIGEKE